MSLIVITTTLPGQAEATVIASRLVEERLAACVQLAPITSVYRWEGAIETADEVRLDCKTVEDRADALAARLASLHPYDEPEILIAAAAASTGYAAWARAETRPEKVSPGA